MPLVRLRVLLSPHSWGTRGKHEHAASSEETVDDADGRTCIIFHISTILPTDYLPYTIQLKSIGLGSYSIYRTTIFYIPYYETAMCLMFDTVPYCICTVPYYRVHANSYRNGRDQSCTLAAIENVQLQSFTWDLSIALLWWWTSPPPDQWLGRNAMHLDANSKADALIYGGLPLGCKQGCKRHICMV